MCTGHKVLMEVDDNPLIIIGDPQGILDQQLSPHSMHLSNILWLLYILILSYILFNYF